MTQDRWREAGPFRLRLNFESVTAVRGVARATFTDQDDNEHDVLIPDFADMIPHMAEGKISGEFKIQKRGQKYGLKLWGVRGQDKAST
jgi:hypothetical protein